MSAVDDPELLLSALAIGHRPKLKALPQLKADGFSHIVTLLSAREGADAIIAAAHKAGLGSIWIPLSGAMPVEDEAGLMAIRAGLRQICQALQQDAKLYIHCSAGIHRTGMMTHALLRYLGFDEAAALALLAKLRPITAEQVGEERLAWGRQFQSERIAR